MAPRVPRSLVAIVSRKRGRDFARLVFTPLDKAIYRLTGGRRGLSSRSTTLYLTTTGRKTGQPRRVPVLFLRDGNRYWVMASNYGTQKHPAWSANLLADPNATIQVGDESREVRARLASGEEKAELWPRLLDLYPAWKQYSEWTDRDFRLFCLEPR